MKNTKLTQEQIEQMVRDNPITIMENGTIRTCPVRLAFTRLATPNTPPNDDGTTRETYGCALLFPPAAGDMPPAPGQVRDVLQAAWDREAEKNFPDNKHNGQFHGVHSPMHSQAEKAQYPGYTPGGVFINVASQFKPQVVDTAMNPIPDALIHDMGSKKSAEGARCYGGVWAIVTLNCYAYGNKPGSKRKGVNFGLGSVMIIRDDEKFGGTGEDVKSAFKGVKLDNSFDPNNAFGNSEPAQPEASEPLIGQSGPTAAQGANAAPAPAPAPAAPAAPKQWPYFADGHFDPTTLKNAGYTRDQLLAAGFEAADLDAHGV